MRIVRASQVPGVGSLCVDGRVAFYLQVQPACSCDDMYIAWPVWRHWRGIAVRSVARGWCVFGTGTSNPASPFSPCSLERPNRLLPSYGSPCPNPPGPLLLFKQHFGMMGRILKPGMRL
ncbi:hypothetical protein OH76DRAFT_1205910 [Lentinus brumalis]|uniref:Uncharacterized protein n=1 Tax=Lentinus brumalis TaxID=2498619 RepID=A0A371CSV5_9APHY|nr:hypothetical protein OH76DRAFT_1205910 [Polyporus brumalis]